MKQLFEIWSAKPSWKSLTAEQQQQFIDSVLGKVGPLIETGLNLIASGFVDTDLPNSLPFQYYAFWEAEDAALITIFAEVLRDSDWFVYFDQINIGGTTEPLPGVLAKHVTG